MFRVWLILLIFLFSTFSVCASISRLSTSEGLSQSQVNKGLLDSRGFLWLATENGLNRYDGYQVLRVSGPNGELEEASIFNIYQDKFDRVWISTLNAGMLHYDLNSDQYQKYDSAPQSELDYENDMVFNFLSKNKQQIWLAKTGRVELLNVKTGEIDKQIWLPIAEKKGIVRAILEHQGYLFMATAFGVYVYEHSSGEVRLIPHRRKIEHEFQNNTKTLKLLDQNTLLVGAVKGLYEIDLTHIHKYFSQGKSLNSKTLMSDLNIWDIDITDGQILLATDQGLINYARDGERVSKNIQLQMGGIDLVDNNITDLVRDNNNGLWLATKADGAFYVPNLSSSFININSQTVSGTGFSNNQVWAIQELNNVIWIATDDGLTRYDPLTGKTEIYLKGYLKKDNNPRFEILNLHKYEDMLYLQAYEGIFQFDPNTKKISRLQSNNSEDKAVLEDRGFGFTILDDGTMYLIHLDKGFYKYNIHTGSLQKLEGPFEAIDPYTSFSFLPPLPSDPMQPLFFTQGRLYRYNHSSQSLNLIYSAEEVNKKKRVIIQSYIVDKNNILWLSLSNYGVIGVDATSYELVHRLDTEKFDSGRLMYGMQQDDQGMIWMSSHTGIWRLNPDNLHLQQFTTEDGLVTNEFNSSAYIKLKNNMIAYGSPNGFTLFDPALNRPSRKLLDRVNITSVELMSRKILTQGLKQFEHLELEHDDIGLEVTFSAMSFNYQDRIAYEYQISGGKKILTRGNNKVVFPKLNPGSYQLKVWAKDPLTGEYTPPAVLSINVKYPVWRSPIAIVGYMITFIVLLLLWMQRRNRVEQMILAAHRDTQNSEMRLKLALESSDSGVWDWQLDNHLIYQPRLTSELGYASDMVTFDEYLQKIHPAERAIFRIEWLEFVSTNKGYFNCTYRLQHKEGHWRWYKDSGKVMAWADSVPERVTGTFTNLTRERMFAERARLFGAAFEQARDWIFILDKHLRIRACNTSLQQAFAIESEPLSSSSLHFGLSKTTRMHYLRRMTQLSVSEFFTVEEKTVLANGQECDVLVKVTAVSDSHGDLCNYVVTLTDISAQKRSEQVLYELSNYDSTTRLANKSLFIDRVQHAIEQAEQGYNLVVLAIRINRLKHFYDIYGKALFEELLQYFAKQLQVCVGEHCSVAIGSNYEFLVLFEHLEEPAQATHFIGKIIQHFEAPHKIADHNIPIKPFIGVACYPSDADGAESLCHSAKMALNYAVSEPGSDYQFFKKAMNVKAKRTFAIEQNLMKSLEEGSLYNHYQPVYNCSEQHIEGFEVSIHWPENIDVTSTELGAVARQAGLSHKLLLEALSIALIELKQWHLEQPQLYVALNLTLNELQRSDLIERIHEVIKHSKVPANFIVFELTESLTVLNSQQAIDTFKQLKSIGCQLHINGFGSDYASLSSLHSLPVDALKIAPSLIQKMASEQAVIVHSIITLANMLERRCIAEGITNKTQIDELLSLGCGVFQGPLIGDAVTGEKVYGMLTAHTPITLQSK